MEETHKDKFTIHLGITKVYQDLRKMLQQPRATTKIATMVTKCMTYDGILTSTLGQPSNLE